jgi:hypothetical protein
MMNAMTPEERAVALLNGPLAPRFEDLRSTVQWTVAVAAVAQAIRAAEVGQRERDAAVAQSWPFKKGGYTELASRIREGAP